MPERGTWWIGFQDWSEVAEVLETKGYPASSTLIKVIVIPKDPRIIFRSPDLKVFRAKIRPLTNKLSFNFEGSTYTGEDLEREVAVYGLLPNFVQAIRALIWFGVVKVPVVSQERFALGRFNKDLHFDHPLKLVQGIPWDGSKKRYPAPHLDIFLPDTLRVFKNMGIDPVNSGIFMSPRQAVELAEQFVEFFNARTDENG